MKPKKLNKSEREVIIRKIRNASFENYNQKTKELEDNFIPTEKYSEFEAGVLALRSAVSNLTKLLKKYDRTESISMYSIYTYTDSDKIGKAFLENLRISEIENYPSYPSINDGEIEDDLILTGIDPDWSIDQVIEKYAIKY